MKIIHIKQNITLYEIMNLRNHSKFIEIKKANNIPDDFTGILEFETFGSYGCFQVYFHNGCLGNDNGSWFHSNSSTNIMLFLEKLCRLPFGNDIKKQLEQR